MWRGVLVLLAVSAGLSAPRCDAAHGGRRRTGVGTGRLRFHWGRIVTMLRSGADVTSSGYRAELKQARLSAHLLNVTACGSIAPR